MLGTIRISAREAIAAGSIASVVPLIAFWPHFHYLFYFHDDWLLLDRADRQSLVSWLFEPFAGEGIFPLFKLLWLGAVHLTAGSYFSLIVILWITHGLICLLFGWLLARFGLAPGVIVFALLTFGLAWTNIETLGWYMQWGSQLSIVFFLLAWHCLLGDRVTRVRAAGCFLFLVSCALCSTRGIAFGVVLAAFVLVRAPGDRRLALLCVTPTLVLSTAMWLLVPHQRPGLSGALLYAARYLVLNPLYLPLPFVHRMFGSQAIPAYGILKWGVIAWALRKSGTTVRPLLWTLVSFDVIVGLALGYGRASTGLSTATGSRYQYVPLLCFGPMAGIVVARLRLSGQVAITLLCAVGLAQPWKHHIEEWSTGRGKEIRAAIDREEPGQPFDPSSITVGRARELMREHGLH